MNDQTLNKANELLDKMISMADKGLDQAPAVLQDLASEYMRYFLVGEMVWLAIGLVGLLIGIVFTIIGIKKDWNDGIAFCFFIILISFTIIAANIKPALQAYYAPKAFMIEKLRGR